MVTVLQAYRFALDPTARQQGSLASHTGAARFAYNWGLELVATRLEQRKIDPSAQVPWTLPDLRLEWTRAKHDVAPWWAENSKEAYNSGLDALARALKNWTDSRNGRRKGSPMGFPRRKAKRRARVACRFTTGAIRVLPDRKHVQLPRIGVLKTHESTRKLARRLEQGTARILAATISRQADRWFVSFTSKSSGPSRPATASRAPSGWTWASDTWRCCPPARPSPTLGPSSNRCASCDCSTGNSPAAHPDHGVGTGPGIG
jgi:putative transposase